MKISSLSVYVTMFIVGQYFIMVFGSAFMAGFDPCYLGDACLDEMVLYFLCAFSLIVGNILQFIGINKIILNVKNISFNKNK